MDPETRAVCTCGTAVVQHQPAECAFRSLFLCLSVSLALSCINGRRRAARRKRARAAKLAAKTNRLDVVFVSDERISAQHHNIHLFILNTTKWCGSHGNGNVSSLLSHDSCRFLSGGKAIFLALSIVVNEDGTAVHYNAGSGGICNLWHELWRSKVGQAGSLSRCTDSGDIKTGVFFYCVVFFSCGAYCSLYLLLLSAGTPPVSPSMSREHAHKNLLPISQESRSR